MVLCLPCNLPYSIICSTDKKNKLFRLLNQLLHLHDLPLWDYVFFTWLSFLQWSLVFLLYVAKHVSWIMIHDHGVIISTFFICLFETTTNVCVLYFSVIGRMHRWWKRPKGSLAWNSRLWYRHWHSWEVRNKSSLWFWSLSFSMKFKL